MIRQIIGLILSILAAVVMTLTCSFDTEELIDGDLAKSTGGKYKFLTILNLHLQAIYYYMCIVNFFFGSDTLTPEKCSLLQKIRDCIFAGLAFPVGMFVCITFWSLYHFDRELIFPEELDHLLPPIINHAMHTLPGVAICLENLVHHHRYPSRLLGLSCVITVCVAYAAWIHYLNYIHWVKFQKDVWVYPILSQLSVLYRGMFLIGLALFHVGLYFIGEMYTLYLTNFRIEKLNEQRRKIR